MSAIYRKKTSDNPKILLFIKYIKVNKNSHLNPNIFYKEYFPHSRRHIRRKFIHDEKLIIKTLLKL